MYYIDGKSRNLKLKSSRNYLANNTRPKLCHWLFMPLGWQTDTQMY